MEARFAADGIHSLAVHPGAIATDLGRHLEPADLELLMGGNDGKGFEFKSVPAGAATTCWAASAPELDGVGGRYLLDCRVAEISEDPAVGVAAYAVDAEQAEGLWACWQPSMWVAAEATIPETTLAEGAEVSR